MDGILEKHECFRFLTLTMVYLNNGFEIRILGVVRENGKGVVISFA